MSGGSELAALPFDDFPCGFQAPTGKNLGCEGNPELTRPLPLKVEGLVYALRLLKAFEPEFRALTDAAIRSGGEPGNLPLRA